MSSGEPLETTEPAAQACRVLLDFIGQEHDARKQKLMIHDCLARADTLPAGAAEQVRGRLLRALQAPSPDGRPAASAAIMAEPRKKIDVLLVTVIAVELEAAKIAFDLPDKHVSHENRRYYATTVQSAQARRNLAVVVTDIGRAGNVSAATALNEMQRHYDPAACFLVGIAGGLRDTLNLGDVVRPEQIIDYERGVALPAGEQLHRPDPLPVPEALLRNMNYHQPTRTGYYDHLNSALERVAEGDRPPAAELNLPFRPGFPDKVALITGEKVRRDGSLVELNKHNDLIKAVDMESTGFARAVSNTPWAVFRGISDYADQHKADNWHMVAALAASVALRDFLETQYEPPEVARL
jgi:adenosylhomocysteine nucleosidase